MPSEDPRRITMADMGALVGSGQAEELLNEYDGGPTRYQGVWWYLREAEVLGDFVVADAQLSATLDGMHASIRRSDALAVEALRLEKAK